MLLTGKKQQSLILMSGCWSSAPINVGGFWFLPPPRLIRELFRLQEMGLSHGSMDEHLGTSPCHHVLPLWQTFHGL